MEWKGKEGRTARKGEERTKGRQRHRHEVNKRKRGKAAQGVRDEGGGIGAVLVLELELEYKGFQWCVGGRLGSEVGPMHTLGFVGRLERGIDGGIGLEKREFKGGREGKDAERRSRLKMRGREARGEYRSERGSWSWRFVFGVVIARKSVGTCSCSKGGSLIACLGE